MKNLSSLKLFLCLALSLALNVNLFSQEINSQSKSKAFYLSTLLEISNRHLGFSMKPAVNFDKHLVSLRILKTSKRKILPKQQGTYRLRRSKVSPAKESYSEVSLLYGRRFKKEYGHLSISTGVSKISGVKRGEFLYSRTHTGLLGESLGTSTSYFEEINLDGFGLPIVVEAVFKNPMRSLGFGFTASATFTPNYIFVSFGVGLSFYTVK